MTNVHLRDLPPGTLEILKDAARMEGRSLNAELVRLLNGPGTSCRTSAPGRRANRWTWRPSSKRTVRPGP